MVGVEEPWSREAVVTWAAELFDHDARTAAPSLVRLADAAARTGDTELSGPVLDEAWRLLVLRPSAAPALLPVAGRLLDDRADPVRLRAAHLLAVLGRQSARYADRLATLLDDPGRTPVWRGPSVTTRAGRSPGSATRARCRGSSSGSTSPIGSTTDVATASVTHDFRTSTPCWSRCAHADVPAARPAGGEC